MNGAGVDGNGAGNGANGYADDGYAGDAYGDEAHDDVEAAHMASDGRKLKRNWKQRLVLTGLSTVVVMCLVGVAAAAYGIKLLGSIERYDVDLDPVVEGEPINYLIIGSDEREGGEAENVAGQRSDSIVVLRVDPQDTQISVLRIPRDLEVPISRDGEFDPAGETTKINAAYTGGRQDLIDTLQGNFGIPIHHYIEIKFDGFADLINAVGGIEVYVAQSTRDTYTGLWLPEAGCQTLDGEQALALVRSRHMEINTGGGWESIDPVADLGRGTRQQEFIRQAIGKAVEEAPTNPDALLSRMQAAADTIGLDDSLRLRDLANLAGQFRSIDASNPNAVQTFGLPVDSGPETDFVTYLRELEAEPILNVFRGKAEYWINPELIHLQVLNGTGTEEEATNVAGAYQELGFAMLEPGDLEGEPLPRTTVYHAPGERALAVQVARHVAGDAGATVEVSDTVVSGEVELVTGPGFEGVQEEARPIDSMPPMEPGAGSAADAESEAPAADADAEAPENAEAPGAGQADAGQEASGGAGGGGGGGGGGADTPDVEAPDTDYGETLGGGQTCV